MSTSTEQSPSKTSAGLSSWWKPFKRSQNSSGDTFSETPSFTSGNLVRPSFNLKSRSFTSTRPRLNEEEIRQQRDQFISSNKPFELGNEIFGVPLQESIDIADSLISVPSDDPNDFIRYGKIPLIIGKCGSHLKEKGIKKEGIFRVAGSSRRVKELQYIFSTSPDYGRKMSWDGYTVHDAASIFRRFLNNLPQPLVPLELYDAFRLPVSSRPRIITHIQARNDTIEKRLRIIQKQKQISAAGGDPSEIQNPPFTDDDETELSPEELEKKRQSDAKKQKKIAKEIRYALKEYRTLIDSLPIAHKHLLYYLLDMLNMFAEQAKDNLMPARNLAAIFQPSILSHPNHDLNPDEYALSQAVVELLIEYSKRVLPDIKKDSRKDNKKYSSAEVSKSQKLTVPQIITTKPEDKSATESSDTTIKTSINHNTLPKVTSNANLKVYRNNSAKNRPHSHSLSSASGIPDHIKKIPYFGIHSNHSYHSNHTDQDESSDDEEYQQTKDEDSLVQPTISNVVGYEETNTPIDKINTTTIPKDRKRPVSMFPTGASYNVSIPLEFEKEERRSRWVDHSDRLDQQELGLSPPVKKESWFNRLRSSSRGSNSKT